MDTKVLRSLVLLFSLNLALPMGWCCAWAVSLTRPGEQKKAVPSCCSRHQPQEQAPRDSAPQSPCPARPCCCVDRVAPPSFSWQPSVDLVLFLPASGEPATAGCIQLDREADDTASIVWSVPVHIAKCVWLC